ncbi:MAG: carbon-nitrogen hydrolase family protein [Myxococcota bacterium]
MRYRAAVVQTTTTPDPVASLEAAEIAVREAAESGARLVALPEVVNFMGPEGEKAALAEPLDGPTFQRFADLAEALDIHLLAGSLPERSPYPEAPYNTSVLYDPAGRSWVYRKIHLFDVDLRPQGPRFSESDRTTPGSELVVADTALGRIGLTICYDLRFPELFLALADAGAEVILVPSAFTVPTGADHWEVLLRARAIETQSWVLAPAQFGRHHASRRSYGRSLIADPWGLVVAQCPDRPSIAYAEIDLEAVVDVRRRMPCRAHRERRSAPLRMGGAGAHRRG